MFRFLQHLTCAKGGHSFHKRWPLCKPSFVFTELYPRGCRFQMKYFKLLWSKLFILCELKFVIISRIAITFVSSSITVCTNKFILCSVERIKCTSEISSIWRKFLVKLGDSFSSLKPSWVCLESSLTGEMFYASWCPSLGQNFGLFSSRIWLETAVI